MATKRYGQALKLLKILEPMMLFDRSTVPGTTQGPSLPDDVIELPNCINDFSEGLVKISNFLEARGGTNGFYIVDGEFFRHYNFKAANRGDQENFTPNFWPINCNMVSSQRIINIGSYEDLKRTTCSLYLSYSRNRIKGSSIFQGYSYIQHLSRTNTKCPSPGETSPSSPSSFYDNESSDNNISSGSDYEESPPSSPSIFYDNKSSENDISDDEETSKESKRT
ncbi:5800_t:CDS:2 [Funneliformis geosporum]|nr:5800_t:CDS:2 [Funneliformis geosporum]